MSSYVNPLYDHVKLLFLCNLTLLYYMWNFKQNALITPVSENDHDRLFTFRTSTVYSMF